MRGAAPMPAPSRAELGRRYLELLGENLGQPGFRELLVTVHDMDAHRDLVFALLQPRLRRGSSPASPSPPARARPRRPWAAGRPPIAIDSGSRRVEAFDLAGAARDHVLDAMEAALALPLAVEPHLMAFAPEGPWRGETHRVCDRPGGLARLLEEVAAAGAEQVILVSPRPRRPGSRTSSAPAAATCAAAPASSSPRSRRPRCVTRSNSSPAASPACSSSGRRTIRSARSTSTASTTSGPTAPTPSRELLDRGYEDAYRQFIEPVVGASGEKIATVQP